MRRVLLSILLATALAFAQAGHVPATAQQHAEEHAAGEAPMPNEIWWKWANFAVLAGGLGYLIGKHAGPFFRSRTTEIQKGISEATQVRADAEKRAAEIESRIGNLSGEIAQIRSKSSEEIAAEGARVQAETAAQIKKLQSQAEMEIASAAKNATLDLKAYSAQLALELAEQQIRQRMDQGAQEDLANAFVSDLKREQSAGKTERLQ